MSERPATRRVRGPVPGVRWLLAVALAAAMVAGCSADDLAGPLASAEPATSAPLPGDPSGPAVSRPGGPRDAAPAGRAPRGRDVAADDTSLKVLGQYEIEGDALPGAVPAAHRAVWARFAALLPAATRPEVTHFLAIDAEGSDGTVGAMQHSSLDPADWYVALDVSDYSDARELDRTMLHEFAHLLTLRESQVPLEPTSGSCPVATADEACPRRGSYLFSFYQRFWPQARETDVDDEQVVDGGPDTEESQDRFATGDYVTEYAATQPAEDVAEVFAEWVLAERASGSGVKGQKLRFFDGFPEAVRLKGLIRTAL